MTDRQLALQKNGNGPIQNALNFTLEMCEKHKPATRVSEHHKPGFQVWQNERVSPGPGFQSLESEGHNLPARGAGENFGDVPIVPLHFYQIGHLILIYFGVNGLTGKSGGSQV